MQAVVIGKRLDIRLRIVHGRLSPMLIGLALAILFMGALGCEGEKPSIRIGFSGGLSGRYSDLGVGARNGVQLAVEEINRSGGIHGRRVELSVKDDRNDPETAVLVDRELIRENVAAIIGHMTSAVTTAAIPLIDSEKLLLISPTTSTSALSGIDDWFFRTAGTNDMLAVALADYLMGRTTVRRMNVIFDSGNRAYTETFLKAFRSRFVEPAGRLTLVASFSGGNDSLRDLVSRSLLLTSCDGVLLLASGLDAAWICQQIRKQDPDIPIFATGWSMTQEFLEYAGKSADGVRFIDYFNWNSQSPLYVHFYNSYSERFGSPPAFSAVYAYEAAQVLFEALRKNPDPKALKQTITGIRRFSGLFGDFEIDAFGDAHRKAYLLAAEKGRFLVKE